MARLTTKERNALPASDFAGPNRTYPVEDASHQRNAAARASQAVNAGRISKAEETHIMKKAHEGHEGHHKVNSEHTSGVGAMMPHEKHTVHEDNVMHTMHMKHGATHPDSKGGMMHGDGSGHFSGH